jgi:hypothetical protein
MKYDALDKIQELLKDDKFDMKSVNEKNRVYIQESQMHIATFRESIKKIDILKKLSQKFLIMRKDEEEWDKFSVEIMLKHQNSKNKFLFI